MSNTAYSRNTPVSLPFASFSKRPPIGSGCPSRRPSFASAALFKISAWPVSVMSITGWSGEILSRDSRLTIEIEKDRRSDFGGEDRAIRSFRCKAAIIADFTSSQGGLMPLSFKSTVFAGWIPRCTCASFMPGMTVRPPRSMDFVAGPASDLIFADSPTATMRSPRIATASTYSCEALLVKILPLNKMQIGRRGLSARSNRQKTIPRKN